MKRYCNPACVDKDICPVVKQIYLCSSDFASQGGRDPELHGQVRQPSLSGPETGKRKRVARKADGKLMVNLAGSWHEKLTLLVTHFSSPILAYPFQVH